MPAGRPRQRRRTRPRSAASTSCLRCASTLSDPRGEVVNNGNNVTDREAQNAAVGKSHQAAEETHPIPEEELVQQRKMWPDDTTTLQDEPVRRDEDDTPGQ